MNSSKLNMFAGAFLGSVFVLMTIGFVGDAIFHREAPDQQGYVIAVAEGDSHGGGEAAEEPGIEPIGPLLASADPAAGQGGFKKCAACHSVDEGGANKVGPNLWNIVNRPIASADGFKYSSSLTAFAEGGTAWDYEHLNGFLLKPKAYVKGTSMGFAGISKPDARAEVIAYLRSLSNDPAPLPDPNAAPADEAAMEEKTTTAE